MTKQLKAQVNEMIYSNFYGYVNGIENDGYKLLTRAEWIDYILNGLKMDIEHGAIVNGLEFKHLYFYGKENIIKAINKFLDSDDDAHKYILN